MRPANVFQLEIASAFAGTRALVMRLGFALLLGLPFALVSMPAAVRASGLVMLLIFGAFFGAAVGTVRRRAEGQLERLSLLPQGLPVALADMVLAGALLDVLQIGGVLVLFVTVGAPGITAGAAVRGAALLVLAVLPLNLLGTLLGLSLGSNAEVHLVGALGAGLIGLLSGIFPLPLRLRPIVSALAPWNPVALFHRFLAELGSGSGGRVWAHLAFIAVAAALVLWRSLERKGKG